MTPVSLFERAADNVPRAFVGPLGKILGSHRVRNHKDGPLWSPATYPEGATRANANVRSVSCLVYDVDDGTEPAETMLRLEGLGLAYVIHSSFSHRADHPKWRLAIPLLTPHGPDDHRDLWHRGAVDLVRACVDPAGKDPARIFYLPSCPLAFAADKFLVARRGKPLDARTLAPLPVAPRPEQKAVRAAGNRPGDALESEPWESILEPEGWRVHSRRGEFTFWTRPGKDRGISARTGPGTCGDRFYCWSSSVPGLTGRILTKFALWTELCHGGDFRVAAAVLRSGGAK